MRAHDHRLARRLGRLAPLALLALLLGPGAGAQDDSGAGVRWQHGPLTARLGTTAQIELDEDYLFADAATTRMLMQRMGNPPTDREVGLVTPVDRDKGWYLVFEYSDVGYVRDDDKDEIDADEILDGIREGTEAANEERGKLGFTPLHVKGWIEPPHYDATSHNLVWALEAVNEGEDGAVANYNVRLLGRKGYMSVTLATDSAQLAGDLPEVEEVLGGFSYTPGNRYAEFVSGDKVARYGLTALIAGGAGAAAVKLGLFAKLAKLLAKGWKLVLVGLAAAGSAIKKLFTRKKTITLPDPPRLG